MQREGEAGPLGQHRAPRAGGRRAGGRGRDVGPAAQPTLKALGTVPEGFELHPKLAPLLKKRARAAGGQGRRGLGHRGGAGLGHAAARGRARCGSPARTPAAAPSASATPSSTTCARGKEYVPLNAVAPPGARFEVHDSLLSEAAVMGFEFGYAVAEHRALVMWEAQFGDFLNGAQVIVDQFLVGARSEVGPAHRPRAAAAARPRGAGARALQRAHRALPDPVRRGQHARVPTPRRPRRTSTCCAARAATPWRSRWW